MNIGIIFPKDSEALFYKNSKRSYGGANIQLFKIAKQLSEFEGINVKCFIPDYNLNELNDGLDKLDIVKAYEQKVLFPIKFYQFHKSIVKNKIDFLLQRGLTLQSCILAFYCYLFKIKYIFMFAHDIESLGRYQKKRNKNFLFPLLLRFSYKLIVQNEIEYNNIVRKVSKKKIAIIKKGLDLQNNSLSNIKNFNKVYDCIWIARCDEWKNPEVYIQLAKKFKDKKFIMVLFSSPGKEDYYQKILTEVKKVDNITLYDFIPNEKVYDLLAHSKIFCITSDMEGDWPMVVLEVAYVGLPVISLHINYNGLISKYDGGFYCESDIKRLYKYFDLLVNDIKLIEKMSNNARNYILENHNIVENVNKLVVLLQADNKK
ncbi:MAG: glycosyltransferase [Spirochaetes bacterium]|nr:glycosyltransferase [Spirochaetota bacterium]